MSRHATPITQFIRKLSLLAAGAVLALAGIGAANAKTCSVPGSASIGFGQLFIQPNAQVGDVLATTSKSYTVNCPADTYPMDTTHIGHHLVFITGMQNSSLDGVWATNTAGIGMRVTNTTHNMVVSGVQCPNYSIAEQCKYAPSVYDPNAFSVTFTFKFELIKTGAIPANANMSSGYIIGLSAYNIRDGLSMGINAYANAAAITLGNTTAAAATCTVQTHNIAVTLPDVLAAQLKPVGATGGDTPFQIDLACDAGKKVYLTLTDASDPGNTTNQLTLSSASSASGVKLQVLKDGAPVKFGPDSTAIGNPGQWLVGDSTGLTAIPLTAQYVSTGPLKPGLVSAAATFTLSYQ